jgi:hypothetical protein
VDRLGRNYADVTDTIGEFIRRGVIVRTVINGLTFDGTTRDPMQQAVRDSLIAFMAATAQSQAEVIKEVQKAGIAHAQTHDDGSKYRGRKPTFNLEQFRLVQELLRQGIPISAIAQTTGLKRQFVYRIKSEPEQQLASVQAWYPAKTNGWKISWHFMLQNLKNILHRILIPGRSMIPIRTTHPEPTSGWHMMPPRRFVTAHQERLRENSF